MLLSEINKVYHDNKQMLLTLETKQQMLIRGMISQIIRAIKSANEDELNEYAQYVAAFSIIIQNDKSIPPEILDKVSKDYNIDPELVRSAFQKLAQSPQVMKIIDEVVQAFDKARED